MAICNIVFIVKFALYYTINCDEHRNNDFRYLLGPNILDRKYRVRFNNVVFKGFIELSVVKVDVKMISLISPHKNVKEFLYL